MREVPTFYKILPDQRRTRGAYLNTDGPGKADPARKRGMGIGVLSE